jgi:hypothetical protein
MGQTTKVSLWILVLIVFCFFFDHSVSELMSAFGYDDTRVSNIWFLRDQYEYLKNSEHVTDLDSDPFHVYELFVWFMIPLNVVRLLHGIFFLGYSDDVWSKWTKRDLSGGKYVIGLFAFSIAGLSFLIFNAKLVKLSGEPLLMQHLLAYSPKAFVGLEAYVFCIGSLLFADAILALIQLKFGPSRKHNY